MDGGITAFMIRALYKSEEGATKTAFIECKHDVVFPDSGQSILHVEEYWLERGFIRGCFVNLGIEMY